MAVYSQFNGTCNCCMLWLQLAEQIVIYFITGAFSRDRELYVRFG